MTRDIPNIVMGLGILALAVVTINSPFAQRQDVPEFVYETTNLESGPVSNLREEEQEQEASDQWDVTLIMQVILSVVVGGAALFALITRAAESPQWAAGALGTILGFWLRASG